MAVDEAKQREQERRVEEFYGTPVVRGASEFALGITGLSITNVKAVGHQFRKIVGDPAAKKLDKDRGEDTGTQTIPERVVGAANSCRPASSTWAACVRGAFARSRSAAWIFKASRERGSAPASWSPPTFC